MKEYLFFAVAVLAMTGCSQDEVMEVAQKEAISFKDAFVENATRAIDNTYSNANKPASFLVYGNTQGNETNAPVVPIFKGVTVSNNGSGTVGDDYKYDAQYTQYWIKDNKYNFAAVVNGGTITTGTDGLPTTITYTAESEYANQKDLLYATATQTGVASNNPTVGFTFNHLLSKAKFTVNNKMQDTDDPTGIYFYRVSDVKITNANNSGTYYVVADGTNTAATWNASGSAAVSFGNVNDATTSDATTALEIGKNSSATSHYERLLIPADYNALNITCTIETLIKQTAENGDVNYAVINSESYTKDIAYTFVAGNAYNFIINLGNPGEPIKFTVSSVTDWDTDWNDAAEGNNEQVL